jgi:hypothetical protein
MQKDYPSRRRQVFRKIILSAIGLLLVVGGQLLQHYRTSIAAGSGLVTWAPSSLTPKGLIVCELAETVSYESTRCLVNLVRSGQLQTSTLTVVPSHQFVWLSNVAQEIILKLKDGTNMNDTKSTKRRGSFSVNHIVLDLTVCSSESLNLHQLVDLIPSYAVKITVLLAEECKQNRHILEDDWSARSSKFAHQRKELLAANLTGDTAFTTTRLSIFFHQFHPTAEIEFVDCDGGGKYDGMCFELRLEADLLVCAVASPECIVAATVTLNAATVVESPTLYPWLPSIPQSAFASSSFLLYKTDHEDDHAMGTQYNNKDTTVMSPLSCTSHIRGRTGSFQYDPEHANKTFYNNEWMMWSNIHKQGPFSHSSYVWEDDHCDVELMALEGFCEAMKTLNISRIFSIGDSLQYMQMISFFELLGFHGYAHMLKKHLRPRQKQHTHDVIQCPPSMSFKIEVVFYRSNHMFALGGGKKDGFNQTKRAAAYKSVAAGDKKRPLENWICYGISKPMYPDKDGNCPWVYEYLGKDVPTLIMTGIGAHFHSVEGFTESFDSWIDFLHRNPRPNDIILHRTVHPGHLGTYNHTKPYASFHEFLQNTPSKQPHDWGLFIKYNQYMEEQTLLLTRNKTWNGAQMHLSDVYWMTALRKDGHPSPKDGLHYLLPGPPDWWNHLLFTNMRDLAKQKHR